MSIVTPGFREFLSKWRITVSKTRKPLVWHIRLNNYVYHDLCMFAFRETFKEELKNKDIEILPRTFWQKLNTDFVNVYIKFKTEADEALFIMKELK